MSLTHINSIIDLDTVLLDADDKLLVIDFHAVWCPPCHAVAPKYEGWAKTYDNAIFAKCDVDKAREVSMKFNVTHMPSFALVKNGKQVEFFRGIRNLADIENAIKKHSNYVDVPVPEVPEEEGPVIESLV